MSTTSAQSNLIDQLCTRIDEDKKAEFERLLAKTVKSQKCPKKTGRARHSSDGKTHKKGFSWTSIWQNRGRPSAFSPYRPTTVLTNLSRGNIPHDTPGFGPFDITIHQLAARGELNQSHYKMGEEALEELDEQGLSPLMWACFYGQVPTVKTLLANGCSVNRTGCEGQTALHLAASSGHFSIVKLLLEHGAMVDVEDENACTPLMFACQGNHPHCVDELLEAGADITAVNLHDQNAFTVAVLSGSKLAQSVMEQHIMKIAYPKST